MATAVAGAEQDVAAPVGENPPVPRDYNFAADVLQSNLDAGRANKPAFIDMRGVTTYGQLAERVARFGAVLRSLGIQREERVLLALLVYLPFPALRALYLIPGLAWFAFIGLAVPVAMVAWPTLVMVGRCVTRARSKNAPSRRSRDSVGICDT